MRSAPGIALATAAVAAWAARPAEAHARCKPAAADRVVERRAVGSFREIQLNAPASLVVRQGAREGLTVRADRRVVPHLETAVRGGRLEIDLEDDRSWGRSDCIARTTVEVTVVNLTALGVSGAGSVRIDGLKGKRLALGLSGAATVRLDRMALADLDLSISGAGKVQATGQATRQEVTISGTGQYEGEGLTSETAAISISGTGNARVLATRDLDATVSGVGSIQYLGNPRVRQQMSGMGKLGRIQR
jgi:hypothetical protein